MSSSVLRRLASHLTCASLRCTPPHLAGEASSCNPSLLARHLTQDTSHDTLLQPSVSTRPFSVESCWQRATLCTSRSSSHQGCSTSYSHHLLPHRHSSKAWTSSAAQPCSSFQQVRGVFGAQGGQTNLQVHTHDKYKFQTTQPTYE